MLARRRWTRNELIIALNVYHKLRFGQLHARQPVIIAVAKKLGRSASSVAMKLCNFASLDPALTLRGIKGLTGAGNFRKTAVSLISKREWKDRCAAFIEGAATGAPGFIGIPFNVALSFLLYFRATQSTALYYGYDVRHDPRELQFASEVTLTSLEPNLAQGAETLGGLIGKMILAVELSALSQKSDKDLRANG
jgi:hypothetical protein